MPEKKKEENRDESIERIVRMSKTPPKNVPSNEREIRGTLLNQMPAKRKTLPTELD